MSDKNRMKINLPEPTNPEIVNPRSPGWAFHLLLLSGVMSPLSTLAFRDAVCSSAVIESGRSAGIWATNKSTRQTVALTATENSGTFIGVYSAGQDGRDSVAIAITPQGIQFRGRDGKQRVLTLDRLEELAGEK